MARIGSSIVEVREVRVTPRKSVRKDFIAPEPLTTLGKGPIETLATERAKQNPAPPKENFTVQVAFMARDEATALFIDRNGRVVRTVDMEDDVLPDLRSATSKQAAAVEAKPRRKARKVRKDHDEDMVAFLRERGYTGPITRKVTEAYLDYVEEERRVNGG